MHGQINRLWALLVKEPLMANHESDRSFPIIALVTNIMKDHGFPIIARATSILKVRIPYRKGYAPMA
ncbi:MAG: hypothetical protein ACXAB4_12000 [Candidatus Hodarchaeales archaeon]|jgi:hypothetical protein